MNASDTATLHALLDREAIRDCLYRYCRGVDRCDEGALRSAYWPDGTDRHGAYNGSAQGFIDSALEKLKGRHTRGVHRITNILIELRGEQALVESYFDAVQQESDVQGQLVEVILAGRYLDRFELRGREWRILARTVVYDRIRRFPMAGELTDEVFGPRKPNGAQRPGDPLYAFLDQV